MSAELRRLGRYELQERLGHGGMAEVWKAFDTQLQRYVAIKILHPDLQNDPDFVMRFEREARIIAALHHPNIIEVYDFQVTNSSELNDPVAYMVMHYVQGQTLAPYLQKTSYAGKFPTAEELLALFTPICLAIDYAHQHGMIHCDLKPSNILLDEQNLLQCPIGEPIISDFGISRLLTDPTRSQEGSWSGTPAYISPEQVQNGHSNERSDIYSLSVILYETCTGVLPYQANNPLALALQHVNSSPTPPALINPNIPPPLAAVIVQGLAKDPAFRFPNACALLEALAKALNLPVPGEINRVMNSVHIGDALTHSFPLSQQPPISSETSVPTQPSQPQPIVTGSRRSFSASARRKLGLFIGLAGLLLAVIFAGILVVLPRFSPSPQQGGGMIYFLNSGQINQDGSAGITDEVQIDLSSLPSPASGNAYYGWLLSDAKHSDVAALLLGTLPVTKGNVHLLFRGDAVHANILAVYSRFLVTEESMSPRPVQPALDRWRYYGQISQQPVPTDIENHYSLLDHVRHLVSDDPTMHSKGLNGGLNLWLARNTEKALEVASTARDEKNASLVQREIIRFLDYIDGVANVNTDVPSGTPFLISPPLSGQVGLLTFDQQRGLPGLLTHIEMHLEGLVDSPGATSAQKTLATLLDQETKVVQSELTQARQDAKQLVAMNGNQLAQPTAKAMLNDLYQQTNQAYVGQTSANNGQLQGGVEFIAAQLQHLAIMQIVPMRKST